MDGNEQEKQDVMDMAEEEEQDLGDPIQESAESRELRDKRRAVEQMKKEDDIMTLLSYDPRVVQIMKDELQKLPIAHSEQVNKVIKLMDAGLPTRVRVSKQG